MRHMRWKAVATLALICHLALGPSLAHALCEPIFVLTRGDEALASLGSCELDPLPRVQGIAGLSELTLALRPAALERWQAVLDTHGPALVAAQLQLGAVAPGSLPRAVLLPAASARRQDHAHWRWDGSNRLSLYLPADAAAAAPVSACSEPRLRAHDQTPLVVWFGDREVMPGEVVLAHPFLTAHPGERASVPRACLGSWVETGTSELHVASAGLGVFQVPWSAVQGQTFRLSVPAGERAAQGALRVIGPREAGVVGLWVQVAEYSCDTSARWQAPTDPIRELAFSGRGTFSITWQPFESRVDVQGIWRLEAQGADSLVLLQVEEGSPHGTAPLATGRLLSQGSLDVPGWRVGTSSRSGEVPRGPCGARFRKVGS